MTLSITKLCIVCHYAECYDYSDCRYAECHDLYFVMLSVVILSVLSVIMLSVVAPSI